MKTSNIVFLGVAIVSLVCFEMFNFATSSDALGTIFGNRVFLGLALASWLALAFCGMDFAGLVKILTPERGKDEPVEVVYVWTAWAVSAVLNAILTWWAVMGALLGVGNFGNELISRAEVLKFAPLLIAMTVLLTRFTIIGAITNLGESILHGKAPKIAKSISKPISRPAQRPSSVSISSPVRTEAPRIPPQPLPAVSDGKDWASILNNGFKPKEK